VHFGRAHTRASLRLRTRTVLRWLECVLARSKDIRCWRSRSNAAARVTTVSRLLTHASGHSFYNTG
jgi:hypothetical protein